MSAKFGSELGAVRLALDDLLANFAAPDAQGSQAYAGQMTIDHPDLDRVTLLAGRGARRRDIPHPALAALNIPRCHHRPGRPIANTRGGLLDVLPIVVAVNEPISRPSQAQIEDAVTTTLVGWGREFDMFQKFWWMDWRKMIGDVVEAMRTGQAVVYEDDEPGPNDRRVGDDPSPVDDILALLDEVLNPKRAGIWLLARNRSLGGKRPIDLIASGELDACAAPPNWSSSAPACDRFGARFF